MGADRVRLWQNRIKPPGEKKSVRLHTSERRSGIERSKTCRARGLLRCGTVSDSHHTLRTGTQPFTTVPVLAL